MNTLIVYASKYGCTGKCAAKLAQKLTGKVDLHDLRSGTAIDLSAYDKIIIGSSVYIGKVHKEVSEFCVNNLAALQSKAVGLFTCGMQSTENRETELSAAYPAALLAKAAALDCFGGEFTFSKMSFMDKMIVKAITKTNKDTSTIQADKIESFAQKMNNLEN